MTSIHKTTVNQMKIEITKMLRAGLDSEFICTKCNVSPSYVKEIEEEYIKGLLSNGSGQRARIRNLLLRNSPHMINVLFKAATQDVDNKLQMSAATTFLNFATRFLRDDATIASSENKVNNGMLQQTLFDFTIPGEPGESQGGRIGFEEIKASNSIGEFQDEASEWGTTPDDYL